MREPDVDRLPPSDLEAEQAVIGAILQGGTALLDVERIGLSAADFYRDAHKVIFTAAQEVASDDGNADMVMVGSYLHRRQMLDECGGWEYLDRLHRATPFSENAVKYARIVRETAISRERLFLLMDAAKLIYAGDDAAAADKAAEAGSLELVNLDDVDLSIRAAITDWREAKHVAKNVIPTDIPSMDRALGGGFYQGNTHLIRGETGKGKSSFAIQLCSAAIDHGFRVGYIAGELTRGRVAGHLISLRSGVPQNALRRGLVNVRVPEYRRRSDQEATRLWDSELWDLVGVKEFGGDLQEARSYLMRMADRGADLIVVDNFTNVTAQGDAFFDRYDKVKALLHRFATHDFGKPVLVLSQKSTRGDGKGGTYASSALDHDSAMVYDIAFDKATLTGKGEWQKGRYDELLSMQFECDPITYRWIEVDDHGAEVPPWQPDDAYDFGFRSPLPSEPDDDDPFDERRR